MVRFVELKGYWHTLKQYWANTKGHHDIVDYGKALLFIVATIFAVMLVVSYFD